MDSRILITGAGSPAGVELIRTALALGIDVIAADSNHYAAGLYLVPEENRLLRPPSDAPELLPDLLRACVTRRVSVVIPTVQSELAPLARHRGSFESLGVRLIAPTETAIAATADRWALVERCAGHVPIPRMALMDGGFHAEEWRFPICVKPRLSTQSVRAKVILEPNELLGLDLTIDYVAQEFLPGADYHVHVLADGEGEILASVAVERMGKPLAGSMTCRTIRDPELLELAAVAYRRLGLSYAATLRLRRDARGKLLLVSARPRISDTVALLAESGVDMAGMLIGLALGQEVKPAAAEYAEVGMVRVWQDHFVDPEELDLDLDEAEAEADVAVDRGSVPARAFFH